MNNEWRSLTDHQKASVVTITVLSCIALAFIIPKIMVGVLVVSVAYAFAYVVVM